MRHIRRYNDTGEVFACDDRNMTMTGMLAADEQDKPLADYELDHDMSHDDLEHSTPVRTDEAGA